MSTYNINAIELLKEVSKKRLWHQNKIEKRKAAVTKTNLFRNKLSYEKACEILTLLGYAKTHEEVWHKNDTNY